MNQSNPGDNASNVKSSMSTEALKTISPAARKFAEYIARRMVPMIEHAGARADSHVPDVGPESDDTTGQTKH
jgi:hypothetical protein